MSTGLYSGVSGLSLGVGLWSGVPGLWSGDAGFVTGIGGASLSLNFLTTTSLDSRITFTRASAAMLTDSTGKLTYAPNNLVTFSEQFDNAAWTKTGGTVTANAVTSPDGATNADTFAEDTSTGGHGVLQTTAVADNTVVTASAFIKAAGRSWVAVAVLDKAGVSNRVWYNVSTGTQGITNGTVTAFSATNVGGGWYRIAVTVSVGTGGVTPGIRISSGSADNVASYTGNGAASLYFWGAQLELVTYQTTAGTYNSTTPKNFAPFTQEFDNAAWTKTSVTVTANIAAAPDGTLSADKLIGTAVATGHFISGVGIAASAPLGTPYAGSVYVKESGYGFAFIGLNGTGYPTAPYISVNLATGATAVTNGAPTSYAATSVGNGWWRVSIIGTTAASGSVQLDIRPSPDGVWANRNLAQNGTDGILIWGAQLSDSASLDPYVYNPGAAPTSSAYQGPRFDYDPVTLAPRGLLIEEQRTNLLVRSEEFDNATWVKTGTTVSANAATSPDGTADADSLVEDSATSDHRVNQPSISAGSGANTFSVYLKAGSRTFARIQFDGTISAVASSAGVDVNLSTGATGSTAVVGNISAASVAVTNVGNGWYRVALTATLSASGTLAARVFIMQSIGGSTSYTGNGSGNILLYGAQLEAGAFATSYIPTVASQVTRSADVATMTGTNFSSWYNQSEGTIVTQSLLSRQAAIALTVVATVNDGTNSNTLHTFYRAAGTTGFQSTVAGVTTADMNMGPAITAGTVAKIAGAYQVNNFAASTNGGSPVTTASGTLPTVNRLQLGSGIGVALNGYIQSFAYYPTRLPQ